MRRDAVVSVALPALMVSLVGLAVLAPVGVVGGERTDVAAANVAITGVNVTPSSPVPGETVTMTVTVENFETSDEAFVVEAVTLRTGPGSQFGEVARARSPGRITPGASLDVPLTRTFESTGERQFRVVVSGRTSGGSRLQLTALVSVEVREGEPRVTVDLARPIAGVESNATVTVANGLDRDLRNLEVRLSGDVLVERSRQVRSTLAASETGTFGFEATPTAPGETPVTATVEYTLANGPTRTVTATTTVRTEELDGRVALTANATNRRVTVTATNLGNVDAERLVIGGDAANATVGRAVVGTLRPGETTTVTLPVREVEGSATVDVRADYEVGDGEVRTAGERVTIRSSPGRIELTGIDVQAESGHLLVTGSASNVGLAAVDSVVVRVLEREGVRPVAPNREYFVGSVPASDFVSFDVTARVDEGVTTIPLQVTYLSDGERRVEEVAVPIDESALETPARPGGGRGVGNPLVLAGVGAVVVVVVGLLVYVGWRNRRVGD